MSATLCDSMSCYRVAVTNDITGCIMPDISVRGIDPAVFAELKARARSENASVNALVLKLIDQGLGRRRGKPLRQRHGDLDSLAGTWKKDQAAEFARASAAFGKIDPELWK